MVAKGLVVHFSFSTQRVSHRKNGFSRSGRGFPIDFFHFFGYLIWVNVQRKLLFLAIFKERDPKNIYIPSMIIL